MGVLSERVALVTGGGSGIGRAVALLYAAEGARVVVSDVDEAGGEETVRLVGDRSGEAIFVRADASSEADNAALVERAVQEYGALHVACNNAGITGPMAPTGEYPVDDWDRVIAVNLSGVFYGMRHQIGAMLEARSGAIVNMSSILGRVGFRTAPAYVAAKHGLLGLTKAAALEYGDRGVRVNAVGPAFIRTPLIEHIDEKELVPLHPLGRLGRPEEVAELVLFLSSEKSSFVTGSYYAVDGGYLAQ